MMHDTPGDGLRHALLRMSLAVRPTAGAADTIHAGVRRARRRRALGTTVGAGGLVMAIVAGAHALTGSGDGPRESQPQPHPASSSPSATRELFECPAASRVLTGSATISDLEHQRRVVRRLMALSSVQVHYAAPSPLGVVALVVDDTGDLDRYAEPAVVAQLEAVGATHVFEWDPSAGMGGDGQVGQVLGWLVEPAIRDVRRATRGLAGSGGLALWQDAGAVLLQWKAPVPPEVRALAGVRPDGVTVIVEPVDYSDQDLQRAQRRLQTVLRERGLRNRWSSSYGCGDGSGLIVGIVPPLTDRAELQEDLTEALGLPVMVVAEERPGW